MIYHFVSALGNKLTAIFIPHQILENIFILKAALILVSISLCISSLALLILVVSQYRRKKSPKLVKSNVFPVTLRRTTKETK